MTLNLLRHYNSLEEYNSIKDSLRYPIVSSIEGIKNVFFIKNPDKVVEKDDIIASDIVLSKYNGKKVIIHKDDYKLNIYPKNEYTPIGIVVIPNSHNVYGDGSCGVMSLSFMSSTSPTIGTVNTTHTVGVNESYLYWGVYGEDISNMNNYGTTISTDNNENETLSLKGVPFLPSDYFTGTACTTDKNAYYNDGGSLGFAPSPYLNDGSRNPSYYDTSIGLNSLSDFNGRENTNILLSLRGEKDYSTWKPTWNSESDYPAASCCDMFYTDGTKQGDWYLPSVGEFGYIQVRLKSIMESMQIINSIYGSTLAITIKPNDYYWTSTERTNNKANSFYLNSGQIDSYGDKKYDFFVIAFTKIKIE